MERRVLLLGLAGGVSYCLAAVAASAEKHSLLFSFALLFVLISQGATVLLLMGGRRALRTHDWSALAGRLFVGLIVAAASLTAAMVLAKQFRWNLGSTEAFVLLAISLLIAIAGLLVAWGTREHLPK